MKPLTEEEFLKKLAEAKQTFKNEAVRNYVLRLLEKRRTQNEKGTITGLHSNV